MTVKPNVQLSRHIHIWTQQIDGLLILKSQVLSLKPVHSGSEFVLIDINKFPGKLARICQLAGDVKKNIK